MVVDMQMRARADAVASLQAALLEQWQPGWADHSSSTREYAVTVAWWNAAASAFLDPVWHLPELVRARDATAIEQGLTYLETAPRCFRSGYVAERLMRRLARATLTIEQSARAIAVVLAETEQRQSRGWRDVGALAGSVWGKELDAALTDIAASGGQSGHRAARIIAAARNWQVSTASRPVR